MKRSLLIGMILMAGCHISLTGCSSEEILDETEQIPPGNGDNETDDSENSNGNNPEEYVTMTFTSESDNNKSRASVVEGSNNGNQNILRWDKGDEVTVMTGKDMNSLKACPFTTEEGGHGSALFVYQGPSVDTKTYFGIHNATYETNGKQIRYKIPTGNGDNALCQTKKNSSIHLNKFRPMYTDIQVSDENLNELTGLKFKHLSSLFVFNILNDSGKEVTVNSIKTTALSGNPFYDEGVRITAEIGQSRSKDNTVSRVATLSNFILLKLGENGNGLKAAYGEIFQAYQSLLPVDLTKTPTEIQFELDVNGNYIKTLNIPSGGVAKFEAGKYYKINLRINKDESVDFINIEVGFENWGNGGNIIIPID